MSGSRLARHRSRAFTVVEMMVVIAIIGSLVALLLPAVQYSRESGRRTQCLNNLRQLGLATHSVATVTEAFPHGCVPSPKKYSATTYDYGHSWLAVVLPHLEQGNLSDQLDLVGKYFTCTGLVYQNPNPYGNNANAYNGNILRGLSIGAMRCPGTTLPKFGLQGLSPPGPEGVWRPTYVGIGGAVDHRSMLNRDATTNPNDAIGRLSFGGVLNLEQDPTRPGVRHAQIKDGLSMTLMAAEQSDWCYDASGTRIDCRSDYGHGFTMGPRSNEFRNWNTTTVRYGLNRNAWNQQGVGNPFYACNRPLTSSHRGVVSVVMADGAVRLLADGLSLSTLYNLSNRDDGNVMQDF